MRQVIELFRDFRPPEKSDRRLTPHEARLLGLLVDGHNLKNGRRGDRCQPRHGGLAHAEHL
jgi:hypothetical protein